MNCRAIVHSSFLYTGEGIRKKRGRHVQEQDMGRIEDGAIIFSETEAHSESDSTTLTYPKETLWVGPTDRIPSQFRSVPAIDLKGQRAVLPGLIDSHTHLVFAGDRSEEFALRCGGVSYEEIARRGGGILSTVQATRASDEDSLYASAVSRLKEAIGWGTRGIEIKSGYGLNWETERKQLKVAQRLKRDFPEIPMQITFLGAHAFPKEMSAEHYLQQLVDEMLPIIAREKLADACDVFMDDGYFSWEQTQTILSKARSLRLKLHLHADELKNTEAASLAAKLRCLSADHLLKISDTGIQKLAQSETVATLLPGTAFYLKAAHAPARKLLDAGARVALATDFNPGTCMTLSLPFVLTTAALYLGMTQAELLAAVTYNAAAALGWEKSMGTLLPGDRALFTVAPFQRFEELYYRLNWAPRLDSF